MFVSLVLCTGLLSAFVLVAVPDVRKFILKTAGNLRARWSFGPMDGWVSRQSSPWPIVIAALLCAVSWAW
jgi:hypothetical protein